MGKGKNGKHRRIGQGGGGSGGGGKGVSNGAGAAAVGRGGDPGGNGKLTRIPPLMNDAFLSIFGGRGAESVTLRLLNALLRMAGLPEVDHIDELSADSAMPGGIECRTARCDILIRSDGDYYDIESHGWHAHVGNKSLFYASRLLSSYTPKGGDGAYYDMPQVVVVTLLHGQKAFPKEEGFLSTGCFCWKRDGRHEVASDRTVFLLFEMDKVAERYNADSPEVHADESLAWLYLLAKGYSDEQEASKMIDYFSSMQEFAERYGIALNDPDLKRQFDLWVESTLEYNTMKRWAHETGYEEGHEAGLADGFAEGRAKGLAEGRKEGLAEGRKEGLAEGREEGREEGRTEGREEGLAEGRADIIERLREVGVDEAVLQRALVEVQSA